MRASGSAAGFLPFAVRFGVLSAVLCVGLAAGPAMAGVYAPALDKLGDPTALVAAMQAREAEELPVEALAVYVTGLQSWRAGKIQEAETSFTLAAHLDPGFPEPYLALARLHLFHDPAAAATALWAACRAVLSSFLEQQRWIANLFLSGFVLVAAGFLLLVGYAALQHLSRLHHATSEIMAAWFPGRLAGMCALMLFFVPALWRIGGLPLAFLAAGLLWPWMRRTQQRWIAGLGIGVVVAPFVLWALSPFLLGPLDPAGLPFLLSRADRAASSPELIAELEAARKDHPQDAELCFVLASLHKRAGDYKAAETLYQESQDLGASPAVVQNNLAVLAFLEEDYSRALDLLQRSVANDPERVAAHFNLSQTYAKKLFFEKADQELRQANRLSIDQVRTTLRVAGGEARRTLIDERVPSLVIWKAVVDEPRHMPGLPASMDVWFRGSLWLLPGLALICFAVAVRLGRRLFRHLPATACANCGRPICRRCLKRIRQEAYCAPCGEILLRIQSASYSKLVLDAQIRRKRRLTAISLKLTSWTFPGLFAARRGRDSLGAVLALASLCSLLALLRGPLPVRRLVWLEGLPNPWWPELPALALGLVLATSIFTVYKLKAPAVRSRPTGSSESVSSNGKQAA
jgi:tetratricopeptide (TPR) repeat protein